MNRISPEYANWRQEVLERDRNRCVLCASEENIHVHHIIRWIDDESLRLNVKNGATICEICHDLNHHETGQNFPKRTTKILNTYIENIYTHKKIIPIKQARRKSRSKRYWEAAV